jgi:hypothetical protein
MTGSTRFPFMCSALQHTIDFALVPCGDVMRDARRVGKATTFLDSFAGLPLWRHQGLSATGRVSKRSAGVVVD